MLAAGITLGVLALALLVGSFIWRRRLVVARRVAAALLLIPALILTIAGQPSPAVPNRPAPVADGALLYTVITSNAADGYTPLPASIVALDARTGATHWKHTLTENNARIVTVSAQSIVAVSVLSGMAGGRIFALDAATGAMVWQYTLADQGSLPFFPIFPAASPHDSAGAGVTFIAAADAVVAVTVERTDPETLATHITTLRAGDGTVLWKHELHGQVLGREPAYIPGALCLIGEPTSPANGTTETVTALSPTTGDPLWTTALPKAPPGGKQDLLSVGGGQVFVSNFESDGYTQDVVALRAADGVVLWRVPVSHGNLLQLLAGPDTVFAIIYGKVLALDAATGAMVWQLGNDDLQGGTALDPHDAALVGDSLYLAAQHTGDITDEKGQLTNPETAYAVNASSGMVRWTYATRSANSGHVAVQSASLYVSADDGLAVLSTATGALRWHSKQYGLPSDGVASSADTPGVMFVGSSEVSTEPLCFVGCRQMAQPYLSAVSANDGTSYWRVKIGDPQRVRVHWVL